MAVMGRILVVDDEPDVATMLAFMLEKDGHSVYSARDGVQALAALGVEPPDAAKPLPDLAIVDVMMPEMDGDEVCARLSRDGRAKGMPVLLLTARGEGPAEPAPNVAARLDKPFDPRTLRETVARLLGARA